MGFWEKQANFPGSLGFIAIGITSGNNMYAGPSEIASELWIYKGDIVDPTYNSWLQLETFPGSKRYGAICFVHEGSIYYGLGKDSSQYFTDVWRYGTVTKKWYRMPDFPGGPRLGAVSFALNNLCFVVCGATTLSPLTLSPDIYSFNPATNKWAYLQRFPYSPVYFGSGFTLGATSYLCCGAYTTSDFSNNLYAFSGTSWTQKATFPGYGRWRLFSAAINSDKAMVGLGQAILPTGATQYQNNFYIYTKSANSWGEEVLLPSNSRCDAMGGGTSNNRVYVGMGYDGKSNLRDLHLYIYGQASNVQTARSFKWQTWGNASKSRDMLWKTLQYIGGNKSQVLAWQTAATLQVYKECRWSTANNISIVWSVACMWNCDNMRSQNSIPLYWNCINLEASYRIYGFVWFTTTYTVAIESKSVSWTTTTTQTQAKYITWDVEGSPTTQIDRGSKLGIHWRILNGATNDRVVNWKTSLTSAGGIWAFWRVCNFVEDKDLAVAWNVQTVGIERYKYTSSRRAIDVDAN